MSEGTELRESGRAVREFPYAFRTVGLAKKQGVRAFPNAPRNVVSGQNTACHSSQRLRAKEGEVKKEGCCLSCPIVWRMKTKVR